MQVHDSSLLLWQKVKCIDVKPASHFDAECPSIGWHVPNCGGLGELEEGPQRAPVHKDPLCSCLHLRLFPSTPHIPDKNVNNSKIMAAVELLSIIECLDSFQD